ncbi:hypothetical protein SO694_00122053 [Aureococcus anophagefferens]|uniref:Uncharacterized protein n=1 Tax=Aureococcus anophagefferens TaxID=44056 RepID=A0ABR1G410_AURAN
MGPRRAQQGAATRAGNVLAPTPSAERPTTADLYSMPSAPPVAVPRVACPTWSSQYESSVETFEKTSAKKRAAPRGGRAAGRRGGRGRGRGPAAPPPPPAARARRWARPAAPSTPEAPPGRWDAGAMDAELAQLSPRAARRPSAGNRRPPLCRRRTEARAPKSAPPGAFLARCAQLLASAQAQLQRLGGDDDGLRAVLAGLVAEVEAPKNAQRPLPAPAARAAQAAARRAKPQAKPPAKPPAKSPAAAGRRAREQRRGAARAAAARAARRAAGAVGAAGPRDASGERPSAVEARPALATPAGEPKAAARSRAATPHGDGGGGRRKVSGAEHRPHDATRGAHDALASPASPGGASPEGAPASAWDWGSWNDGVDDDDARPASTRATSPRRRAPTPHRAAPPDDAPAPSISWASGVDGAAPDDDDDDDDDDMWPRSRPALGAPQDEARGRRGLERRAEARRVEDDGDVRDFDASGAQGRSTFGAARAARGGGAGPRDDDVDGGAAGLEGRRADDADDVPGVDRRGDRGRGDAAPRLGRPVASTTVGSGGRRAPRRAVDLEQDVAPPAVVYREREGRGLAGVDGRRGDVVDDGHAAGHERRPVVVIGGGERQQGGARRMAPSSAHMGLHQKR